MPAVIPFIPLIAAGIGVGAPLIEHAVEGGPPDPTKALQQQLAAQQAAQKQQQDLTAKESAITQAPNIQAQLGGSVAPDYYISETAPGESNPAREALQGFLGLTAGTEAPSAGAAGTSAPGLTPAPGTGTGTGGSGGGDNKFFEELISKYLPTGAGGGGDSSGSGTSGGYV